MDVTKDEKNNYRKLLMGERYGKLKNSLRSR